MSDLVETSAYDEATDTLVVKTSYDNSLVLADNLEMKNLAPESGRYKGERLIRVGNIHLGDIVRLKNMGFNILSPDPDEWRRALLYVQAEEKALMCMPGTPIAKKKQAWR